MKWSIHPVLIPHLIIICLDPSRLNIGIHILLTFHHTFPLVLTRRICLTISYFMWTQLLKG